jgi:hypothetical protein
MRYNLLLVTIFVFSTAATVSADIVYTTSTLDTADLDFDGLGNQTDGALPGAEFEFEFSGNLVPSDFIDIDSFSITFSPRVDSSLSSRGPNGGGIGSFFEDSDPEEIGSLDNDFFERISVEITYSTQNPNQELWLTGVSFISFDASDSQAALLGATHNGGSNLVSGSTDPDVVFDDGVSFFALTSEGSNSFRMDSIQVGAAITGIPEPTSTWMFAIFGLAACCRRRNRKIPIG